MVDDLDEDFIWDCKDRRTRGFCCVAVSLEKTLPEGQQPSDAVHNASLSFRGYTRMRVPVLTRGYLPRYLSVRFSCRGAEEI